MNSIQLWRLIGWLATRIALTCLKGINLVAGLVANNSAHVARDSQLRARAVAIQIDSDMDFERPKGPKPLLSPLLHQPNFLLSTGSSGSAQAFAVSRFIFRSFASFFSLLLYVTPSTFLYPNSAIALGVALAFGTHTFSFISYNNAVLDRFL